MAITSENSSGDALSRLRAAVLGLASETAVSAIKVADLCRAAGVSRDTFYRLAESPVQLLASIFDEELAGLDKLEPGPGPTSASQLMSDTTRLWLEHMARHEAIYRAALAPHLPPEMICVLHAHIEGVLVRYMTSNPEVLPTVLGQDPTFKHVGQFASYAIAGAIGVVERELEETASGFNVDELLAVIHAAAAEWWFRPVADG